MVLVFVVVVLWYVGGGVQEFLCFLGPERVLGNPGGDGREVVGVGGSWLGRRRDGDVVGGGGEGRERVPEGFDKWLLVKDSGGEYVGVNSVNSCEGSDVMSRGIVLV